MRASFDAEPFEIHLSEATLDDLKTRLARTRWPQEPKSSAWYYGTDLAWLRRVVDHWLHRYDWRRWEAELNRFPQFKADIDGRKIHFILERGTGDSPLPLVLTHGWPGSVMEYLGLIEQLAHPERFGGDINDAFTVIVPSLPGFGFSDSPEAPLYPREIAKQWHRLLVDVLGCERYVAQGGDWGAIVTSWLAHDYPNELLAIQLTMQGLLPTLDDAAVPPVSDEERAWLAAQAAVFKREAAYIQIQGTKPQTLAYGLTDSPVGLAAWILEKFHGWTVPGSSEPPPFDLDLLLTNVMLYWLGDVNASTWLYVTLMDSDSYVLKPGQRIEVPTAHTLFPNDLTPPPPASLGNRAYNVQHRYEAEDGGHFPALECGDVIVSEIRSFFRRYR